MPIYSATVQFKTTKAQWTISLTKRADGKGYTPYSIDAADEIAAEAGARAIYADLVKGGGEVAALAARGEEEFLILSCLEPRRVRIVSW